MSYLIKQINKHLLLRNFLLRTIDLYFEYKQVVIGYTLRAPAYWRQVRNSHVLAAPGLLGYKGGVFNPGAIFHESDILLLAKAQSVPWYKAHGKKSQSYLDGAPVIIKLGREHLNKKNVYTINNLTGFPEGHELALEDFRLFKWGSRTVINHSVIYKQKVGQHTTQGSVSSGLSVLNNSVTSIKFLGIPDLDIDIQNYEKNWAYVETDANQLLLFYSWHPYRVLMLEDEHKLRFKTVVQSRFSSTFVDPGGFGTRVSFSTNPIEFDARHWLIVVHQVRHTTFGRCYYHWAVLIEKATLYPVQITHKPIYSGLGARGRKPGIRYISSILKLEDEILFFAGEDDVYTTVTKMKKSDIESLFVNLH